MAKSKKKKVEGVGPNAPVISNEKGGKQSDTPYAFTSLDPKAMFSIAKRIAHGDAKYGKDNWRKISVEDHINHALQHIYAHLSEDTQDDHLDAAFCRMMMAVAVNDSEEE